MSEGSAVYGVVQLLKYLNNDPADGTGVLKFIQQGHNLLGPGRLPQALVDYLIDIQITQFGDYANYKDRVPCAILTAVFTILMALHLFIFFMNFHRGHYFYLSIIWVIYCAMRVIGWSLRIKWSFDVTLIDIGLTSEVFMIVPSIILVSTNLILAQRIFTWRHPVGGSRRLFWGVMIGLYIVVVFILILTIYGAVIPYCYFLKASVYLSYKKIIMFSCVCIVLYSVTAISLLALAYFFQPTTKDENLYTYQPWWIESFAPFYFVPKDKAKECEETFMKRNHNHRHAVRVIAATHHHYNMVEGLTNERGSLKHNISLVIIITTTVIIFVPSILRCIVMFKAQEYKYRTAISSPAIMFTFWGGAEALINIIYILGRVDLRFYRPDVLPAKVRAIITAEQSVLPSVMPSVMNSDVEDEDDDGLDSDAGFDYADNKFDFTLDSPDFEKQGKGDNESEFHF